MFYLIQMSDFHFGAAGYPDKFEERLLSCMTEKIMNSIPIHSNIVLCACGDYIDSRPPIAEDTINQRYQRAETAIKENIIEKLQESYSIKIGLCAGNHDITHTNAMNGFSKRLIGNEINQSYAVHIDSDNADLIFVNSCDWSDHRRGVIDYSQLEELFDSLDKSSEKYLFLHHTIMSMDESDSSSIRYVPALIRLVDKYSVKAIFHGHTHGQYIVHVGIANCPIIGVGAVFSRNYANVNSQFNLIQCYGGIITEALTFQYHADIDEIPNNDGFTKVPITMLDEKNYFVGNTFSEVYDRLYKRVTVKSRLYNVHLLVISKYDDFVVDVEQNFGLKEELETLDNKYSYTALAEMWDAPKPDEDVLYFNHGMYFSTETYTNGIDYVIQELSRKQTSSRALLSTINSKDIVDVPSDSLLPSLMSIQFGFDLNRKTLYITMNLRALEVSRFLKINICEALFLAKQIKTKLNFDSIQVAIEAFRVQRKDRFGCFLKAKIDTETEKRKLVSKLACLIYLDDKYKIQDKISSIIDLIKDKKDRVETVIETSGIESLRQSIKDTIDELPSEKNFYISSLEGINSEIGILIEALKKLKENRASSSIQTETMDSIERQIDIQYGIILEKFEELKNV